MLRRLMGASRVARLATEAARENSISVKIRTLSRTLPFPLLELKTQLATRYFQTPLGFLKSHQNLSNSL